MLLSLTGENIKHLASSYWLIKTLKKRQICILPPATSCTLLCLQMLCLPFLGYFLWYSFSALLFFCSLPHEGKCLLVLTSEDVKSPCCSFNLLSPYPIQLFYMWIPSFMNSRCLALPPRTVWVILQRVVPWCSALTLWTIPQSDPESLSVCAHPAAQPKILPIALAPAPPVSLVKEPVPTIIQTAKKAILSLMLQYQPSHHYPSQDPTLPSRPPLQPISTPLPFHLSETSKLPSQNLASMGQETCLL